jgi:hypothetical protein
LNLKCKSYKRNKKTEKKKKKKRKKIEKAEGKRFGPAEKRARGPLTPFRIGTLSLPLASGAH